MEATKAIRGKQLGPSSKNSKKTHQRLANNRNKRSSSRFPGLIYDLFMTSPADENHHQRKHNTKHQTWNDHVKNAHNFNWRRLLCGVTKKIFNCLIGKWQEFLPRSTLLVIGNFNQVRLMSSCFVTLPLLGERCVTSKKRLPEGDLGGGGNLPNCYFNIFPLVMHYFSARNSFLLCRVLTTLISVLPGRKKSLYRFLRTPLL